MRSWTPMDESEFIDLAKDAIPGISRAGYGAFHRFQKLDAPTHTQLTDRGFASAMWERLHETFTEEFADTPASKVRVFVEKGALYVHIKGRLLGQVKQTDGYCVQSIQTDRATSFYQRADIDDLPEGERFFITYLPNELRTGITMHFSYPDRVSGRFIWDHFIDRASNIVRLTPENLVPQEARRIPFRPKVKKKDKR